MPVRGRTSAFNFIVHLNFVLPVILLQIEFMDKLQSFENDLINFKCVYILVPLLYAVAGR